MQKRICLSLLCLLLLCPALAQGEAYGPLLTVNDLARVQGSYEAFLLELQDLLVDKGLLSDENRERWMMYQLGDFVQNGGHGMIAAFYTPDLLENVREEDSLLRLQLASGEYHLRLDTMRRYTPLDTTLPGLLLELSLTDANNQPLTARFRITASQGGFSAWDALAQKYSDVGISILNDGRACYWSDQPITSEEDAPFPLLTIEVLLDESSETVAFTATLTLTPAGTGWRLADGALK